MLPIKDYLRESNLVYSRIIIVALLILALAATLLYRLWTVQIEQNEYFSTLSRDNRINLLPVAPVRGRIVDRNGKVVADNHAVYTLEVVPDQVRDIEATISSLGRLVRIDDLDVSRFRRQLHRRPGFEPQTLRSGLSDAEAARFSANRHQFPGVELVARLRRHYPMRALMGHLVGYVGRISDADLARIDESHYRGTQYIGKLGIEAQYEQDLLGKVGFEQVETNAHGRIVRGLTRDPAVAGRDLVLTVDSRLQKVADDALADYRGAVVAMEPSTGDILAFVSKPNYDPNPFVDGIDQRSYALLRNSEDRPLLNRALNGRYAPGSTIKGFMGLAVLESGVSKSSAVKCPGWYSLPNSRHRYRCWKKPGHGSMDLLSGIIQSCDVYFYKRARELGIEKIHSYMRGLGFGIQTGVDFPDEPNGLVPSPEWKRRVRGQPWYPGETVIAGIGQGYMLATPLQLAAATATLANRGNQIQPRFVREKLTAVDDEVERMPIYGRSTEVVKNASNYDVIIRAMTDVVHGKRGTARRIGVDSPYRIAGKTGTAQVVGIKQGEKYDEEKTPLRFRDHALFIAFAPAQDPRIAVAVIAENGGSGSKTAAPIAKTVLDAYLMDIAKLYQRPEPEPDPNATDADALTENQPAAQGDESARDLIGAEPVTESDADSGLPQVSPMGI